MRLNSHFCTRDKRIHLRLVNSIILFLIEKIFSQWVLVQGSYKVFLNKFCKTFQLYNSVYPAVVDDLEKSCNEHWDSLNEHNFYLGTWKHSSYGFCSLIWTFTNDETWRIKLLKEFRNSVGILSNFKKIMIMIFLLADDFDIILQINIFFTKDKAIMIAKLCQNSECRKNSTGNLPEFCQYQHNLL